MARARSRLRRHRTPAVRQPRHPRPKITSPASGAVLPPVYDILGSGCAPNAPVELWDVTRSPEAGPNATTVAAADGTFAFTGDTPSSTGDVAWYVVSEGQASPSVPVTVVE